MPRSEEPPPAPVAGSELLWLCVADQQNTVGWVACVMHIVARRLLM